MLSLTSGPDLWDCPSHALTETVNILKFGTLKFLTKWHMQIVQTQIRPILKQSRSSLIRVHTFCHSTNLFKKQLHKKQNSGKKGMEQNV